MRRKDREMDREFALKIIDKSRYGILSMVDEENKPYGIPLSITRGDNTLYFHSAKDGRKAKIFHGIPDVSIAFIGDVLVPEIYTNEELNEILKDESKSGILVTSVFTTEYESVIVTGKVRLVEGEGEKIKAMRLICEKYTPNKMDYFEQAIKSGLGKANLYKVEMEEIRAKRKKYDKKGVEMKYGRME